VHLFILSTPWDRHMFFLFPCSGLFLPLTPFYLWYKRRLKRYAPSPVLRELHGFTSGSVVVSVLSSNAAFPAGTFGHPLFQFALSFVAGWPGVPFTPQAADSATLFRGSHAVPLLFSMFENAAPEFFIQFPGGSLLFD